MKSKLKELLKGSFVYGLGGGLNSLIALLLLPIFTKYLTPEEYGYGVLALLGLGSTFLLHFFTLGLGVFFGICFYDKVDDKQSHQESLLGCSMIVLIFSSLIMILGVTIFLEKIGDLLFSSKTFNELIEVYLYYCSFSMFLMPLMLMLQFNNRKWLYVSVTSIMSLF